MAQILIVDDISLNVDLLQQLLEDDHDLLIARNGPDAISQARSHKPDLILMDIALPGMTGTEAMQQIKGNGELSRIPIIAVTSHAMRGDRANALAAGFDDYLSKPLDDEELLSVIEKHLCARSAS